MKLNPLVFTAELKRSPRGVASSNPGLRRPNFRKNRACVQTRLAYLPRSPSQGRIQATIQAGHLWQ